MSISLKTHKMLWGLAASRCAFPDCRRELVMDRSETDDESLIGEECHMVAREPHGPRGNSSLTSGERDEYDNLVLLCRIHHKLIDDQPRTYPVQRLKEMKTDHEKWVHESLHGISSVWSVPHQRNLLFTGREKLIEQLHDRLTTSRTAAVTQPQAISGLGGIGKTQIAVEYAYRFREAYHAILWARAATRDTLIADFVTMADLLHLTEREEQDQNVIVAAVKRWLSYHENWLLILDNADDIPMVIDFLPVGKGHILLTTRAQATGTIASSIEVDKMDQEEGTLLLLRRAKVIANNALFDHASKEKRSIAEMIVEMMDGLPLALDQAGAYIEETGCGLLSYLHLYQTHRRDLLQRRGQLHTGHPESVTTTWSLSFQKIKQANPAAVELMQLCAFLTSDSIPEEIIANGASELSNVLGPVAADAFKLNEAIEIVRRFSLIQRHVETKTLSIHRLVQEVLKDDMSQETKLQWAERTVRVVNNIFPSADVENWPLCQRYLPQAQACANLIEQQCLLLPEAAHLLNKAGIYLFEQAQYGEAERVYEETLNISQRLFGPENLFTGGVLHSLAMVYYIQSKYNEAEQLYRSVLAITMKTRGLEDFTTLNVLHNLAKVYQDQGKYEEAEQTFQNVLSTTEKLMGPEHPDTAIALHSLSLLYRLLGRFEEEEPLLQRALEIQEKLPIPDHPSLAITLAELAILYTLQRRRDEAEPLFRRALSIQERVLGMEHPSTAITLQSLAMLLREQGQFEEAKQMYERALHIQEKVLGPEHSDTVASLEDYYDLFQAEE